MVNKPVFQGHLEGAVLWGAWFRDPKPIRIADADKIWMTKHNTNSLLYEYKNSDEFRKDLPSKVYDLKENYIGTGHAIYAGSFYYQRSGANEIVKYDLRSERAVGRLTLPQAAYHGGSTANLYSIDNNYFDLTVDEHGLWVIYAAEAEVDYTQVAKIRPEDMSIMKTWNVTARHAAYGNGFIACGTLYLLRDTHAKMSTIDFAYDLYGKVGVSVRLRVTNPFLMTNMVTYNPKDKQIYSWDKGYQLTYQLIM